MAEIKVEVISGDTGEIAFSPKELPSFYKRVDELGDSLNEIAVTLGDRIKEISREAEEWGLEEVTLTFSLDLQAEAGVILARASSRAGFQAGLTWKRTAAG